MSRSSRLAASISVYAVGTFSTQLVGLLLLPVVTRHLTVADYGIVDLVMSAVGLASPILSLGIAESMLRFGMERTLVPGAVLAVGLSVTCAGFGVSLLAWPLLAGLPGLAPHLPLVYALIGTYMLRDVAFQFLRSQGFLRPLLVGGLAQALIMGGAMLLLVVVGGGGVSAYLQSFLLSGGVVALLYLTMSLWAAPVTLRGMTRNLSSRMLRYSIPLMPNGAIWWLVATASRFVLLLLASAAAVGLYSVAARMVAVLAILTQVVLQGWQVSAIEERETVDQQQYTGRVFAAMMGVLFVCGAVLIAVVKPVTRLLVAEDFFDAWQVAVPLAIGVAVLFVATFIGTEYRVRLATAGALTSSVAGAIVAVVSAFPLVWLLGAVGAALATALGYLSMAIVRVRQFGLPSPKPRYWRVLVLSFVLLTVQGGILFMGVSLPLEIAAQVAMILAVMALNGPYVLSPAYSLWLNWRAGLVSSAEQ